MATKEGQEAIWSSGVSLRDVPYSEDSEDSLSDEEALEPMDIHSTESGGCEVETPE
jgi:hypothetical protein